MPGVELDYGDAPDPVSTTQGRYPTLKDNNGARHVVTSTGPMLGSESIRISMDVRRKRRRRLV